MLEGAAPSTRGLSRFLLPPLPGRVLPGVGGGKEASTTACSGNVPREACGAADCAAPGDLAARTYRLSPPELTVRDPGRGCRGGPTRAPSRQVWLGGLSQALIRACPRWGVESELDSFLLCVADKRGALWVLGSGAAEQASSQRSALAACGARAAGIGREQWCRIGWAPPPL